MGRIWTKQLCSLKTIVLYLMKCLALRFTFEEDRREKTDYRVVFEEDVAPLVVHEEEEGEDGDDEARDDEHHHHQPAVHHLAPRTHLHLNWSLPPLLL